jgi:hypothetical protein
MKKNAETEEKIIEKAAEEKPEVKPEETTEATPEARPEEKKIVSKSILKSLVVKLDAIEKAELAGQLADRIRQKEWLEDAKKVATKRYAAQIEETIADINDLSNKIRAGEELRQIKCEVIFDDPAPGYKSTYRLDTMEKIATELMTDDELQGELFPEDGNAKPEGELAATGNGDGDAPKTEAEDGADAAPETEQPETADGENE